MPHDARKGKPAKRGPLGGLFDDLSIAQVIAGALAAVTSMLLASQIGIYGSVIGVGVGSVVSAVASQLYKKFFTASAEKLRDLKPGETGYAGGAADEGAAESVAKDASADKTVVLRPTTARRSRTPRIGDAALSGDGTVERVREAREHKKKVQRRIVAVSVASAVVAVLVSAVVVNLLTQGEGLGARPTPPASAPVREQPQASGDATGAQGQSGSQDASSSSGSQDGEDAGSSSGSKDDQEGSSGSSSGSAGSGSGTTDSGSSAGSGTGSDGSGSGNSGGSEGTFGDGGSSGDSGSGSGSGSGSTGSSGSGATGSGSSSSGSATGSSGQPSGGTTARSSVSAPVAAA